MNETWTRARLKAYALAGWVSAERRAVKSGYGAAKKLIDLEGICHPISRCKKLRLSGPSRYLRWLHD